MKPIKIRKSVIARLEREQPLLSRRTAHGTQVFLMGQTSGGEIVDLEKVHQRGDGCRWMPQVTSDSLHNAYIKLVQKGLIPCGFARVTNRMLNNEIQYPLQMTVGYSDIGKYLLTVDILLEKSYLYEIKINKGTRMFHELNFKIFKVIKRGAKNKQKSYKKD